MVATRTLVTIPLAILHVNYLLLLLHAEVEPSGHILDGMHVARCMSLVLLYVADSGKGCEPGGSHVSAVCLLFSRQCNRLFL